MDINQYVCSDVVPAELGDPYRTTWYHGTKHSQRFDDWKFPPPTHGRHDVAHSGLFFTSELDYAKAAGKRICTVTLNPGTRLITPAVNCQGSSDLRHALRDSHPLAQHCIWLSDDQIWRDAWSTGDVMRHAIDNRRGDSVALLAETLADNMAKVQAQFNLKLSGDRLRKLAGQNLTRGWIEKIVRVAAGLGYQAIQGAEIDRWSGPGKRPVARPWLAVTERSAISSPAWLTREQYNSLG